MTNDCERCFSFFFICLFFTFTLNLNLQDVHPQVQARLCSRLQPKKTKPHSGAAQLVVFIQNWWTYCLAGKIQG